MGPETGENKKSLFPEKIAKEKGEKIGNVIWVSPVPPSFPKGSLFRFSGQGFSGGKTGDILEQRMKMQEDSGRETERVVRGLDSGLSLPLFRGGIFRGVRSGGNVRHSLSVIAFPRHHSHAHDTAPVPAAEPLLPVGSSARKPAASGDHRIVRSEAFSHRFPSCHPDHPPGGTGVF
ncbi:hypothetical protein Y981_04330 [Leptospirillum ferriphilum YSK]|uniref:Uncharacterized protein n=1 Tax=Leptospirillum ferriphilum YSK TaxID=1441628 RepID=A0A059Y276_9BACT|nr:hypothetical protein Y981_04330 [Leptospirillum ferriphilum YSK]